MTWDPAGSPYGGLNHGEVHPLQEEERSCHQVLEKTRECSLWSYLLEVQLYHAAVLNVQLLENS